MSSVRTPISGSRISSPTVGPDSKVPEELVTLTAYAGGTGGEYLGFLCRIDIDHLPRIESRESQTVSQMARIRLFAGTRCPVGESVVHFGQFLAQKGVAGKFRG